MSSARPPRLAARAEVLLCLLCAGQLFSTSVGCLPVEMPWPPIDAAPLRMPAEFPLSHFVATRTNGAGDIPVFGTCPEESALVEARWNGGTWTALSPCTGGRYDGLLRDQPAGMGTLEVRAPDGSVSRTVPDVGVGDVFVVAGQSNAVGMTPSLRAATHPWASVLSLEVFPDGSLFRHADDPLHLASQWFGSAWPIFMDEVIELTGIPVMMIMTAEGFTGLVTPDHWCPDGVLFKRTVRNIFVGTGRENRVTAVLFLQGETDAMNDVLYQDYKPALVAFADALVAELAAPAPVVAAQIGPNSSLHELKLMRIRLAEKEAAAESPNIIPGPCFKDWVGDPTRLHYTDVDAEAADGPGGAPGIVPARWLASVRHLIGGAPASSLELGCGP
jgi:Carbohydrate esterase, sialic acid-specific acetylesterase